MLVSGCGARAVSRKTPIYFIDVVLDISCTIFYQSLTYAEVSNFGVRQHFVPWIGGICLCDNVSRVPIVFHNCSEETKSIQPRQNGD